MQVAARVDKQRLLFLRQPIDVHARDPELLRDGAGLVSFSTHLTNTIGRHSRLAAAIDAPLLCSFDARLLTLADVNSIVTV
jgi:hypothetical protein